MAKQDGWKIFTARIPPDLHEWLKDHDGGMNETLLTAMRRMKAEEQSEDYRRGYVAGVEDGKKINNR